MEKLLHIKKKSKKLSQSFYDDGLGDLLDFCDDSKREAIVQEESNAWTEKAPEPLTADDFFIEKRAQRVKKANEQLAMESDDENQPMSGDDADMGEEDFDEDMESGGEELGSESNEDKDMDDRKMSKNSEDGDEDEFDESDFDDEDGDEQGDGDSEEDDVDGEDSEDDEDTFITKEEAEEDRKRAKELAKKGLISPENSINFFSNFLF